MSARPNIYVSKRFDRFAKDNGITDDVLLAATDEIVDNPNQGNLGGGVIKKRISRDGEGKSGGYRSIVLFKVGLRVVFAFGYPKNSKATLRPDEEKALKKLAKELLQCDETTMARAVSTGGYRKIEVKGVE